MKRRYLIASAAATVLLARARPSAAQQLGPVAGPGIQAMGQGISTTNGIQVGDGVLLHAGVGAEGGYDSNVFYNNTTRVSAPLVRVTPFLELTNTARSGEVPSGLFFDLRASLTYREYFSDREDVTRLRAFVPVLSAFVEHNSRGSLALAAMDTFTRSEDAPYVPGVAERILIRDNNMAAGQLRWSPGGGRLQGLLRFTNTIDYFETDYLKRANSIGNEGMADFSWRWLPKTALYLQVRQGRISYTNTGPTNGLGDKATSYPLRATAGIRGLMTEKTSIALAVGYQNAFYSSGSSTSGFLGSTTAAAELVVLPILTTRIAFGLRHDFQNSVVGNFYYNDGGYASISQQVANKLTAGLWASYDYRRFYGVSLPTSGPSVTDMGTGIRKDNLLQAGAVLDYYMMTWAYMGVSYALIANDSEYQPMTYTKHQVFARLGITY